MVLKVPPPPDEPSLELELVPAHLATVSSAICIPSLMVEPREGMTPSAKFFK